MIAPADLGLIVEVEEQGVSFLENAFLKARAFCDASNFICIADDSGLEIDVLDGEPGIYSARHGGPDLDDEGRYRLILDQLREFPPCRRGARFRCALAVVGPGGRWCTAEGNCEGRIHTQPLGTNGFGYDPIFYLSTHQQTMGQLEPDVKGQISHRARALRALRPRLLSTFPELEQTRTS